MTLEQARAARHTLATLLGGDRHVNGIGIVRSDGGYGLKVNLIDAAPELHVPDQVNGVRVERDVTGPAFPA